MRGLISITLATLLSIGIALPAYATPSALTSRAQAIAGQMTIQFNTLLAPLNQPEPSCAQPSARAVWVGALGTRGDFDRCLSAARACAQQSLPGTDDLLFTGAMCAEAINQIRDAYNLYDLATAPAFQAAPRFKGHTFRFASFALNTDFRKQAQNILARVPAWNGKEQVRLISAVIAYLSTGAAPQFEAQVLDNWITARLEEGDDELRRHFHLNRAIQLLIHRAHYDEALDYIEAHIQEMGSPHRWFSVAYEAFYSVSGQEFTAPRTIYDAYLPFAHTHSLLPLEQNTYTYSELYTRACRSHLTSGSAYSSFTTLKREWAEGEVTSEAALARVRSLIAANPLAADAATLIADILDRLGDEASAETEFWRAHTLCPYYDRAHWGLKRINFRRQLRAQINYEDSLARIAHEVSNLTFAPELEQYVVNWNSLTAEARLRLKYAIRFWAPFIAPLYRSGARLFVKSTSQLLSDVPHLSNIKDTRIEYDHDHRLWDDVRGEGGRMVVVDHSQMMEAGFGDYNLAGHEMTHQFQGDSVQNSLFPPSQFACAQALYQAARQRGVFAEPYSARNFLEYLAQGVGYFMIPADSPTRYGINVSWVRAHDPDLYAFLNAIQTQSADLSQVHCPI